MVGLRPSDNKESLRSLSPVKVVQQNERIETRVKSARIMISIIEDASTLTTAATDKDKLLLLWKNTTCIDFIEPEILYYLWSSIEMQFSCGRALKCNFHGTSN